MDTEIEERARKAVTAVYLATETTVADDLSYILRSLLEEIDILRSNNEILKEDAARIDWYEEYLRRNKVYNILSPSYHPGECSTFEDMYPYNIPSGFMMHDEDETHPTLRAAIDSHRHLKNEEDFSNE